MPTLAENRTVTMPSLRPSVALLFERYIAALTGVAAGLVVLWIPGLWLMHADWQDLLMDKTIDAELGFLAGLIALVAFLPAIEEKTVIRKLKQWGYYRYFVMYLREAVWVAALTMSLTVVVIVHPKSWDASIRVDRVISAVWWGFVLYSLAAVLRIVRISMKSLLAE